MQFYLFVIAPHEFYQLNKINSPFCYGSEDFGFSY